MDTKETTKGRTPLQLGFRIHNPQPLLLTTNLNTIYPKRNPYRDPYPYRDPNHYPDPKPQPLTLTSNSAPLTPYPLTLTFNPLRN